MIGLDQIAVGFPGLEGVVVAHGSDSGSRTRHKMSAVDLRYESLVDRMTGGERMERTAALYHDIREMLARQVLAESPELSPREVRIRVAKIMYLSDEKAQALLQRMGDRR